MCAVWTGRYGVEGVGCKEVQQKQWHKCVATVGDNVAETESPQKVVTERRIGSHKQNKKRLA